MTSWDKFILFVSVSRTDRSRPLRQPITAWNGVPEFQVNRITTCFAGEIMAGKISRVFTCEESKARMGEKSYDPGFAQK